MLCIILALHFLSTVQCKQVREKRELIYGCITHVVFLFYYCSFVCIVCYRYTNSSAKPATPRVLWVFFLNSICFICKTQNRTSQPYKLSSKWTNNLCYFSPRNGSHILNAILWGFFSFWGGLAVTYTTHQHRVWPIHTEHQLWGMMTYRPQEACSCRRAVNPQGL